MRAEAALKRRQPGEMIIADQEPEATMGTASPAVEKMPLMANIAPQ